MPQMCGIQKRGETKNMNKLKIIRWENPPPSRMARSKGGSRESMWDDVAEWLRAEPGRWALVRENVSKANATSANVMIYSGGATCFRPRGSFEAAMRTNVDGTYNLFARYVGEQP